MKIRIVVDANPIMAALLGGISREIFFDRKFEFVTTKFTLTEVEKYVPWVSKRSGVNERMIRFALSLLPISTYEEEAYQKDMEEAEKLIGQRDKKDVPILALALTTGCPLWTHDKDFENIDRIRLVKTKDLL